MAARWTQNELSTLLQNLADGFHLNQMIPLIPNRTVGAIIRQSSRRNYRVETSKVDRLARFYYGVNRRRVTASNDLEVSINIVEPKLIIADKQIWRFRHSLAIISALSLASYICFRCIS